MATVAKMFQNRTTFRFYSNHQVNIQKEMNEKCTLMAFIMFPDGSRQSGQGRLSKFRNGF